MSGFDCITKNVCLGEDCPYHSWMKNVRGDIMCGIKKPTLHSAMAKMVLHGGAASSALKRVGVHKRRKLVEPAATKVYSEAATRLLRFLRLSKLLGTVPWANKSFEVNEEIFMRLTASHLTLICGTKEAEKERSTLLRMLPTNENLDNAQNLCWITNRQQGKARFFF